MSASPAVRRTGPSALRRYSWLTLAASLLLASALLTGDLWYTRAGAVVAFLGGFVSCLLAWREVKAQRVAFQSQSALDLRVHGEKLHVERLQHIRLLRVLQSRNGELRSRVTTARAESARLAQQVAKLRGDNAALQLEVARLAEPQTAEVLALPRRVAGPVSDQEEILWAEGNFPTVVDLKAAAVPLEDGQQRHA